jgi:hypothetical protein
LSIEVEKQLHALDAAWRNDVPAINQQIREAELDMIAVER